MLRTVANLDSFTPHYATILREGKDLTRLFGGEFLLSEVQCMLNGWNPPQLKSRAQPGDETARPTCAMPGDHHPKQRSRVNRHERLSRMKQLLSESAHRKRARSEESVRCDQLHGGDADQKEREPNRLQQPRGTPSRKPLDVNQKLVSACSPRVFVPRTKLNHAMV